MTPITNALSYDQMWEEVLSRTLDNEGDFTPQEQKLINRTLFTKHHRQTAPVTHHHDPFYNLAAAVMRKAMQDYRDAIEEDEPVRTYEKFFRSNWAKRITLNLNMDAIIEHAKKLEPTGKGYPEKIIATHIATGEKLKFESARSASLHFGLSPNAVAKRLNNPNAPARHPIFKEWKFEYPQRAPKGVVATHTDTGETIPFPSTRQAAFHFGVTYGSIYHLSEHPDAIPRLPELKGWNLERANVTQRSVIIATHKTTGETLRFYSMEQTARYFGVSNGSISYAVKNPGSQPKRKEIKDWKFEKKGS